MKYKVGEVVRTIKGWFERAEGPIHKVLPPTEDMQRLWGQDEPHYLIKDSQTGDYISVIERGLEKR